MTIVKGGSWDVYVSGRVGTFFSWNKGDGPPVPVVPNSMIQAPVAGGVDTFQPPRDVIYQYDAMGMQDNTKQSRIDKMRIRSGYYPNILTLGMHKQLTDLIKLTAQVQIWGTVESDDTKGMGRSAPANGIRDNGVAADFREGFLKVEGPFGIFAAGKTLTLVGRGHNEIDALYGHGYGVGFPLVSRAFNLPATGDVVFPGPTGGMAGFGVLGATYSAGITYTTPSLGGLTASVGLYDASQYLTASKPASRTPRPELEIAYDFKNESMLFHVFGSGGVQKLYVGNSPFSDTIWGVNYGARAEFSFVHLGLGGFMGKGMGISYAFDDSPALTSSTSTRQVFNPMTMMNVESKSYELRTTRGFFGILQFALGPVDLNGGYGQTQILLVDQDKTPANLMAVSPLKTQTGFFAAAVYHMNESLHFDIDFINGAFKWYNGESQKMNTISAGATLTF